MDASPVGYPAGLHRMWREAARANVALRSRDPVERLFRDGMLAEEEAEVSRMLLDVAHVVEEQFEKADWLTLCPGIFYWPARLLDGQRGQRGVALLAQRREIGA